jgi:hypothetical protein
MVEKTYYIQRRPEALDNSVDCLVVVKPVDGADPSQPVGLSSDKIAQFKNKFWPSLHVGQNAGAHELANLILADFLDGNWASDPLLVEEFRRDFLNLKADQDAVEIGGLLVARWLSERGLWEPVKVVSVATATDAGPDDLPGSQPNIEG